MNEKVRQAYEEIFRRAEERLGERDEPRKVRLQVGSATCENAAGSQAVYEALRRAIEASGRDDVVIRRVGCTGRCGREPIVGVSIPGQMPVQYEEVDAEKAHRIFVEHVQQGRPFVESKAPDPVPQAPGAPSREIVFCRSARCDHLRGKDLGELLREKLAAANVSEEQARVMDANCFGLCRHGAGEPSGHVLVRPERVVYRLGGEADIDELIDRHIVKGEVVDRLRVEQAPLSERFFQLYGGASFLSRQSRIALRNSGLIDPEDLDEYLHFNGFEALAKALAGGDPESVIDMIRRARLRGRGGAGYPTATKWSFGRRTPSDEKFVICNADEGDPGAFMDRSMLEGDPFSVIEGMMIAGFAIGAQRGFFYIRAEYPLAVERVEKAITACRREGLLGKDILGSGFDFDVEVRLGAGAFVCGEETALINSIEGHRGQPRVRPPYPTDVGLWGKPTVINNVETLGNVPAIILFGPEWFAQVGTEASGGTKVFALTGKVVHTGLVEVPMGTTLREIVYDIGGGVAGGKALKAVQTGGPAGGCIPAGEIDTPVDFDTLSKLGTIMGSGGMIVMDETDCMVDIARFFMAFSQDESCGKCTPCREGTTRMLEILDRVAGGEGRPDDLDKLERLGRLITKSSLCGLGRAAANPIMSTLEFFREEYEAHVREKVCPTGRCPMRPVGKAPGLPESLAGELA
ncbi:MAG: NADH-ubiquinone oxidoreductase-F iron-sulfur binding region domain-containing protein, partial [Myxococcota bacterium]